MNAAHGVEHHDVHVDIFGSRYQGMVEHGLPNGDGVRLAAGALYRGAQVEPGLNKVRFDVNGRAVGIFCISGQVVLTIQHTQVKPIDVRVWPWRSGQGFLVHLHRLLPAATVLKGFSFVNEIQHSIVPFKNSMNKLSRRKFDTQIVHIACFSLVSKLQASFTHDVHKPSLA